MKIGARSTVKRCEKASEQRVATDFSVKNFDKSAQELYAFCPEIIEQDFGNYANIFDSADALPPDYIAHVRRMSEGIDFIVPDYVKIPGLRVD